MILPIVAYGTKSLHEKCIDIDENYPNLSTLLDNMFETMYNASGVGLAAPQIGLNIRLFLVDSAQIFEGEENNNEETEGEKGTKQVFINAQVIEKSGKPWVYEEGCLSIPDIRENVTREETVRIQYYDENFVKHEKVFDKITARVILHEYDHIEGVLFTDYLTPLKKRMLKKRLERISKGLIDVEYRMKFPAIKKRRS
jgi:peptide deformylase